MNTLKEHLLRVSRQPSVRSLALDAGVEPSTLARQLGSGDVKIQTVLTICRRYEVPFLPALVAAGFVTTHEAKQICSFNLNDLTDRALVEELLRRVSLDTALPLQ